MDPEKFEEEIEIETEIDSCCDDDDHRNHHVMRWINKAGQGPMGNSPRIFMKRFGGPHGGPDAKVMHKRHRAVHVHILEEDDKKVMVISLPGLKKESLKVKAKKRAVMVEGTYLEEFQEIYGENITKKFRTPFEIDPEQLDAVYSAGLLKLKFLGNVDPAVDISVTTEDE